MYWKIKNTVNLIPKRMGPHIAWIEILTITDKWML